MHLSGQAQIQWDNGNFWGQHMPFSLAVSQCLQIWLWCFECITNSSESLTHLKDNQALLPPIANWCIFDLWVNVSIFFQQCYFSGSPQCHDAATFGDNLEVLFVSSYILHLTKQSSISQWSVSLPFIDILGVRKMVQMLKILNTSLRTCIFSFKKKKRNNLFHPKRAASQRKQNSK